MRQGQSEKSPLLKTTVKPKTITCAKGAEYAVCLLVAFPTAVLNGLAAISGDAVRAGSLQSPDDLKKLLDEANVGQIVYGVIALSASEAVLFFLNKRYLFASGKAAIDLLRRTILTLRNLLCCYDLNPQDRAGILEYVLFFWSIVTSLIFAEMGSKALSFLGLPGEIIGFSLSLSVYFATRFASAKMYVDHINDTNWRLKQHYAAKLELLQCDNVTIQVKLNDNDVNGALIQFLNCVDEEWKNLLKDRKRVFWLQYAAPVLGYMLVAITVVPIMSGFMPESVQGAELLTNSNIGANGHYQNTASFIFGAFATALTLFFYELNIKDLPKHLIQTALSICEKINNSDIRNVLKLLSLTILASGASYLAGIGFKFVADTALASGYLSYLGNWLSRAIPSGLLIAVVAMLWSHLQALINQTTQASVPLEIEQLTYVDAQNARALLDEDNDISALNGDRHALFLVADNSVNASPNRTHHSNECV